MVSEVAFRVLHFFLSFSFFFLDFIHFIRGKKRNEMSNEMSYEMNHEMKKEKKMYEEGKYQ